MIMKTKSHTESPREKTLPITREIIPARASGTIVHGHHDATSADSGSGLENGRTATNDARPGANKACHAKPCRQDESCDNPKQEIAA